MAQAVDVGAALSRRDQVDVAFLNAVSTFRQPQQCPVDGFFITRQAAAKRLVRQALEFADRIDQIRTQAVFVMPFDLFTAAFVFKGDQQPRTQYGLGFEYVLEAADRKLG